MNIDLIVSFDRLCDGIDDYGNGEEETMPVCDSKSVKFPQVSLGHF